MFSRLRTQASADDGIALVLVIGIGMVMMIFIVGLTGMAMNSLKSARSHVVHAQTIDAAEAGVDQTLARLQKNQSYVSPAGLTITDPAFSPTSGWSTPAAESSWAKTQLLAMAATPANVQHTPQGDFVALRAANLNAVYSMGFVPSVANATRTRLVKAEYIFSSYHPSNAILANGNISCCASYETGLAPGVPPTTTISIHSNGTLADVPTSVNGGIVTGSCSVAGSGCTYSPKETVPAIDPRVVYNSQSPLYAASWYDLCPDGTVRAPNTASSAVPCTGTVLSSTLPYRGWTKSGTTWDVDDNGTAYPGVYYIYQGSVHVGNSHGATITGATTILTESATNRACPRTAANITLDNKSTWSGGPFIPGMMVLSGGNFYQNNQATTTGTGGGYLAQGSVNMHTSSHDQLIGLLLGEDLCGETNDLQGSLLYYDGGDDLPILPLVRTTLELELSK
jgi:hypothetical protein